MTSLLRSSVASDVPSSLPRKAALSVPLVVRRLGWVSFFTDVASEMVYPLLPALLRSFGAAAVWLGVMEGLAEAASAFVKYKTGPIVDRSPRKKPLIVAGYTLATFARPMLAFATMGVHVVGLRALDRIGKGVRGVPRDAMLADSVPQEHHATAFAFHRMMDNAGSVMGPIVAFVLLRALELTPRKVIMFAVVPGILSIAVLVFGVHETAHPTAPAVTKERGAERLPKSLRTYLSILALFTLGSSADSFLLLRAQDIGIGAEWLPVMWLSLSLAKSASNLPGGLISDRFGRKRTLGAAWVLYAIFYAALPYVTAPLWFSGLIVAYGLYYGLAEGAERAILTEHAPAHLRGRAFGAMHALTGAAVLPANLLFGLLYSKSAALAFGVSAACAGVAALLLLTLVSAPSVRESV